jgi:hypothetical protein
MIDEGIKKVIIKNEDLPLIQFSTTFNNALQRLEIESLHYDFRYRIVSEDKNRFSHWSQIIRYPMPDVTTPFPYTSDQRIRVSKGGNPEVVTAIWTKPLAADNPSDYEKIFNKTNIYDVWIRWNTENNATESTTGWTLWENVATLSTNSFSIVKPVSSYKTIEVAIQVPTATKIRDYNNNKLTLFRKFGAV